jgi:hypothetical protein
MCGAKAETYVRDFPYCLKCFEVQLNTKMRAEAASASPMERREGFRERTTIRVPAWSAKLLKVGADGGRFANGYVIEKIGEPFTDKNDRKMVRVTLVERTTIQ